MESDKCDMKACSSGLPASLSPVILIYAPASFKKHSPVKTSITLKVCVPCSKGMTVESIVTDDGWATIMAAFFKCGKVLPDRSRTQLAFETIVHRDAMFAAAAKSQPTEM